ncbi:MAG: hypothetical protein AB7L94_09245 [Kofleriaceae bacterium]
MKRMAIVFAVLAAVSPAAADVRIASAIDATRSTVIDRAHNTATLRRTLARVSSQFSSKNAQLDATIVSLTVESIDDLVVVNARVRIAISNPDGRIVSMLTSNARAEKSARVFRPRHLRAMRDDAVIAAVQGAVDKAKLAAR